MYILIAIILSAGIVYIFQEYRYDVCREVKSHFPLPEIDQVKEAVIKIIYSCRTTEQVLACEALVLLFAQQFHSKVSTQLYNDCLEDMTTRMNRKYIALVEGETMSDIDIDQLLNIA